MGLAAAAVAVVMAVLATDPAGAQAPEVEVARQRADSAAAEVAAARSELAAIEDEAAALAGRAARLEARRHELGAVVRAQLVDRFVRGGPEDAAAELLLQGEDVGDAVRADALARSVTNELSDTLQEQREASRELAAARARLADLASRRTRAAEALAERADAAAAELGRQVVVAAERQAAEEEAARVAASAAEGAAPVAPGVQAPALPPAPGGPAGPGSTAAPAGPRCPVDGPRAFTNDWGQPRSGGRRHEGTDILSPRGTPVVASVDGTVELHQSSLGGISYTLSGDDGNTYFGTHLDSTSGASGRVSAGTVLGTVGNSGNARGGPTHLHFEIRTGGGAVNPYPTVARAC